MGELMIVLCLLINIGVAIINMFLMFKLISILNSFEDDPDDPAKEPVPVPLQVVNF